MTRFVLVMLAAVLLAACGQHGPSEPLALGGIENSFQNGDIRPLGRGGELADSHGQHADGDGATVGAGGVVGYGITYHGGPVLHGTLNAYYIWYGDWSGNSATTILPDFISNLGGSPYYNINTTYGDTSGPVSNSIHYAGSVTDAYSRGTSLSDGDIQLIVGSHINGTELPLDTNGVYFVLTSADVDETTGFCTQYCGWHTSGTIDGADIKFSFVGNADRCPAACEWQTSASPNGNPGADGMASIIGHEFEESASDPDLNAWYDSRGYSTPSVAACGAPVQAAQLQDKVGRG
jgi:hypothetical protein